MRLMIAALAVILVLLVGASAYLLLQSCGVRLPVLGRAFGGAENLYELALPDGQRVLCLTPSHVDVGVGAELPVEFRLQQVVVFPL